MPAFYVDDLDIEVHEFLESCSTNEIKEVIDWLEEDGQLEHGFNITEHGFNITGRESINERMFLDSLFKIKDNWMGLSKEEEEIILNISKRF
jgi:hypothetical protein